MGWSIGGGGDGDGIPSPYNFENDAINGRLNVYHSSEIGKELIGYLSNDGSYFKTSVSTGVGSIHLGGSDSGGIAHSMSSSGQNVGFKNEWATATDGDRKFWFPQWQGVSIDGATSHDPSSLILGPLTTVQPAGSQSGSFMNYDFTITASSDFVVFAVEVRPLMNYQGKLKNRIFSVATGAEIYSTEYDVNMVGGEDYKLDYKYPFFTRTGDNLRLTLERADGSPLMVYKGATDTTVPWRKLHSRTIEEVFTHESMHFGVKRATGTIEVNGKYALGNSTTPPVITVNPRVDCIDLMPRSATHTSTSYTTVKLPINDEGTSHHTIHYMTNNPVTIFRDKTATASRTWYIKYEGYDYVRTLATTAASYALKAGKRTIKGNGTISQANISSEWNIDEFIKVRHDITNMGATVNMYLQLVDAGTYETAHTYFNQNAGTYVNRVMGDITASSTAFTVDGTSTDSERAFIDTVIQGTSDASGSWRWKYKGIFYHNANNNMYWCLEAEYNPQYTV